jgi:hypothetical protein
MIGVNGMVIKILVIDTTRFNGLLSHAKGSFFKNIFHIATMH